MMATFHFGERLLRDGGVGVCVAAPLLVRVAAPRRALVLVRVQHGLEQLQPVQGLVPVGVVGPAKSAVSFWPWLFTHATSFLSVLAFSRTENHKAFPSSVEVTYCPVGLKTAQGRGRFTWD